MRVVFAGTPAFSVNCLQVLLDADSVELAGVCTQPDRPAGRGRRRRHSAVKQVALAHGVPVFQPHSPETALAGLRELRPDLLVVAAYGMRLAPRMLAIPLLGCVNLHASLLPRWRGAAPIVRAIEAGDAVTGVSLMRMTPGLDSGPVLAESRIAIAPHDTGGSLHDKLAHLAGELLAANLPALATGALTGTPQDESRACHARKLTKAEAALDWRLGAAALERKIRAFHPWPVARTGFDGDFGGMQLRVLRAAAAASIHAPSGEIVAADNTGITVAAGDGGLTLTEVQKPGGRPMPVAALLNGMAVRPGMRFVVGG